jgi:aconitate decarboxylase
MSKAANLPKDPQGPTGQLALWLAGLTLDDIPLAVRERAKHLILDGFGCALIGAQMPWSRRAVDIVTRLEGSGNGTLIGWGASTSRPAAALLNGTFIQGFELDDFHPFAPLHSASLVLPSLLACAQGLHHVSGAQFLKGAIAGFEVGPRVGLALHGAEMLSRGWHSGSVFGTHASAAAAGSLLELDAGAFEDALGLAGTQSAGLMAAQFEAMSKRMHHGMASRNGLYAAVLAQGGYTGIKRVFECEYGGFLSTFGEGHSPDASQISDGLGLRWETERITAKAYAAMGGLHAAIDAVLQLDAQRRLVPEEIERIEVDLAHAVFHHGGWQATRPLTPIGAQMNLAYAVAVTLVDRAALIAQFSPDRINQDDVWSLIPRIVARNDEAFDREGALSRGKTRVRILFRDGQSLEKLLQAGRGILPPLTNSQIVDKFRTLTNEIMDPRRQKLIEGHTLALDELPDVNTLVGLLAPPVRAVLG